MNDVGVHIALFAFMSVAIVAFGAMFSEPGDAEASKVFVKRWIWFVGGCALLVAVMLVAEHTFAAVS